MTLTAVSSQMTSERAIMTFFCFMNANMDFRLFIEFMGEIKRENFTNINYARQFQVLIEVQIPDGAETKVPHSILLKLIGLLSRSHMVIAERE